MKTACCAQARALQFDLATEVGMRPVALGLSVLTFTYSLTAWADGVPSALSGGAPGGAQRTQAPAPARTSADARDGEPAPVSGYRAPHVVPYEGGRIPSFAHLENRTDTKLVEAGVILSGVMYGLSLLYALGTCGAQTQCRSGSAWLYVPVVGPYFTAANAPTSGGAALSVFDGAVQTVGAALLVAGLAIPKRVVVWEDGGVAVRVAPTPVAGGAGLVLSLTHL